MRKRQSDKNLHTDVRRLNSRSVFREITLQTVGIGSEHIRGLCVGLCFSGNFFCVCFQINLAFTLSSSRGHALEVKTGFGPPHCFYANSCLCMCVLFREVGFILTELFNNNDIKDILK